ncbi:hypothetical protein [Streptococcus pneumoniae]|nr:hypothetical protein [Streptococcus pneumoniae]
MKEIELTKSAQNTGFEVVDKSKMMGKAGQLVFFDVYRLVRQVS